jgi:hypothetical protein
MGVDCTDPTLTEPNDDVPIPKPSVVYDSAILLLKRQLDWLRGFHILNAQDL